MKTLLLVLLTVSLPVFAQHSHHEEGKQSGVKRKSLATQDKVEAVEVLAKNDLLFNAFLKKDAAAIEKHAKELQKLVSAKKSPLLKEVKAQAGKLNSIKASNSNETNLTAYEAFLNPLIKVVQEHEVDTRYNVFSCPMVKKSWLQDVKVNKGVKNVYAMEMLECGSQDTHYLQ